MGRKNIFFTADTHFFHENSINFDKRPFKNIHHMHRVLINNYNAVVPPEGVCYFLGDVGTGQSSKMKDIIERLNGKKILLVGNHCKGTNALYNIGFDVVMYGAVLYISGERVTLSHCPLRGVFREDTTGMRGATGIENWHGENKEKNNRLTFDDKGQFHLHGHCHKSKVRTDRPDLKEVKRGKQWDIGVCGNNYTPVSISAVESWIALTKREENK